MRLKEVALIAALATPTISVATTAFADENHEEIVKLSDIPAAAREGLQREAAGSPIVKVEEEHKNGRILYEAHVREKQGVIGVVVDSNGKLVNRHPESEVE